MAKALQTTVRANAAVVEQFFARLHVPSRDGGLSEILAADVHWRGAAGDVVRVICGRAEVMRTLRGLRGDGYSTQLLLLAGREDGVLACHRERLPRACSGATAVASTLFRVCGGQIVGIERLAGDARLVSVMLGPARRGQPAVAAAGRGRSAPTAMQPLPASSPA